MNNNRSKASESSTKLRSLSNRVNQLQKESNPTLLVSSLRSNPASKTRAAFVWVPRTVKVNKSSATQVTLTVGDIVTALGATVAGVTVSVKVLGLKVWNVSGQSVSSNYLRVDTLQGLDEDGVNITVGEDYGTSASLPGIRVNVPDLMAKLHNSVQTSSSIGLANATGWNTGMTGTAPQNFLFEVQLLTRA